MEKRDAGLIPVKGTFFIHWDVLNLGLLILISLLNEIKKMIPTQTHVYPNKNNKNLFKN